MPEQLVGTVVHYFKGPGVAVVRVTEDALAVGDSLRFHGHTTEFTTQIVSMEVNPPFQLLPPPVLEKIPLVTPT